MRAPGPTPPSVLRGVGVTALNVTGALQAMDARRRLALVIAAGLIGSLFAPWSTETVTARGVAGSRRTAGTLTGWQGLSFAAVACAAVAGLLAAGLLVRAGTAVDGLGARGRRAARTRIDGVLVAAAGTLGAVVLIAALVDHAGPAVRGAGIRSASSVGWGLIVALVLAFAFLGLGLAIVRAAAAQLREPRRGPAVAADADAATAGAGAAESPMPDFDFAVSQRPAAARTRTASSRSR